MSSSYFGSSNSIRHASDCPCDDCSLALVSNTSSTSASSTPKDTSTISLKSAMTHLSLKTGRSIGRGFKGLKPVRAKIYSTLFGAVSSASTALTINGNVTLTAGNFPEIASWMTVYDEMRVLGGRLHFCNWLVGAASSSPNISIGAVAVMFDPTAGAPSTVDGVLQESFSAYTHPITGYSLSTNPPFMKSLPFHVGKPLISLTSNDVAGSSWFTLDNSSTPTMGVVHLFATDCGTGSIVGCKYQLEFDVEFRMRT
jgi:hypothetical protein